MSSCKSNKLFISNPPTTWRGRDEIERDLVITYTYSDVSHTDVLHKCKINNSSIHVKFIKWSDECVSVMCVVGRWQWCDLNIRCGDWGSLLMCLILHLEAVHMLTDGSNVWDHFICSHKPDWSQADLPQLSQKVWVSLMVSVGAFWLCCCFLRKLLLFSCLL